MQEIMLVSVWNHLPHDVLTAHSITSLKFLVYSTCTVAFVVVIIMGTHMYYIAPLAICVSIVLLQKFSYKKCCVNIYTVAEHKIIIKNISTRVIGGNIQLAMVTDIGDNNY